MIPRPNIRSRSARRICSASDSASIIGGAVALPSPMELAYAPLVAELERRLRLRGVAVPPAEPAPRPLASRKRVLLRLGAEHFGPGFVDALGRELAKATGHPFIRALILAPSAAGLMRRWERLEHLAHSGNRVRVLEVGEHGLCLARVRVAGGAPSEEEDRLVLSLLCGVLEAAGAVDVEAWRDAEADIDGRTWRLTWRAWQSRAPLAAPLAAIGHDSDFVRAALTLLLEDADLGLCVVARQLAVSPRSLQRRLAAAGTSLRALTRAARIARAGDALLRPGPADPSLTTVAQACGFADSAHLSREFRRLVGMPPSTFRRSIAR